MYKGWSSAWRDGRCGEREEEVDDVVDVGR